MIWILDPPLIMLHWKMRYYCEGHCSWRHPIFHWKMIHCCRIVSWIFLKLSARNKQLNKLPIGSMYGILTYISLIFMLDVGKYTVRPMDPMGSCVSPRRSLILTPTSIFVERAILHIFTVSECHGPRFPTRSRGCQSVYIGRERERDRARSIHVSMFSDMSNMGLETIGILLIVSRIQWPHVFLNIQKACDVEWLEIWPSNFPPLRGPRGRWAGATKPLADTSWNPDWFRTGLLYWLITIPTKVGRNIMYIKGNATRVLNTAQMTCSTTSFPIFNKKNSIESEK